MKTTYVCSIGVWCLLLAASRSACGQEPSPLQVTGANFAELQLIRTNAPATTWKVRGTNSNFAIGDSNFAFHIKSGAPQQCVIVAANGKMSITPGGSAVETAPQRSLHIFDPDTPGIRLEQSTLGGNPSQTFDLEASELGFNIIDVSNSNSIPFAIEPDAPTNSLFVDSAGNVGIGTGIPSVPLHIVKAQQASIAESLAKFVVSDDAIGALELKNNSASNGILHPKILGTAASQAVAITFEGLVTTDVGANPGLSFNVGKRSGGGVSVRPLVFFRNNNVTMASISATGAVEATSFDPSSSRTIKHDIVDLDSRKANDALKSLTPVEFVYNQDESGEKRVGFIAEDVPEIVANADRKSVPIMDVLALVTKVVKDQQQVIDEQKTFIDEQRKLNESLVRRLQELEDQMSAKK